jgi:hypothetical protein
MEPSKTVLSPGSAASTPPSNESMFTIGGGQAGLLYALSDDIIRILNKLQHVAAELANKQTEVERLTIRTGADATRNTASQQSLATWMQAGASLLAGASSLVATAAAPLATHSINDEIKQVEKGATPLKDLKESALNPPMAQDATITAIKTDKPAALNQRIEELKNGNYVAPGAPTNPTRQQKADADALDKAAILSLKDDPKSYQKFRDKLDSKIEAKDKESSSLYSQISEKKQDINLYKDIVTNGGGSCFKGAESTMTSDSGKSNAASQTASAIERMADSSANAARGNLNQDFAKVSETISAARQGAQAYAAG